jgi:hypothetical protein
MSAGSSMSGGPLAVETLLLPGERGGSFSVKRRSDPRCERRGKRSLAVPGAARTAMPRRRAPSHSLALSPQPDQWLARGVSGRTSMFVTGMCPAPKEALGTIEAPSPTATILFIASTLSNSINGLGGGPRAPANLSPFDAAPIPRWQELTGTGKEMLASPCRVHLPISRGE